MSDLVRELVLAAEAFDSACDSADPREFDAARARLRAVLPKLTTEDDPGPHVDAPGVVLDRDRLARALDALAETIPEHAEGGGYDRLPTVEEIICAAREPSL